MATKNYMINDKWLDIDKQNIVELQSVDGVLDSLKVNGSEVVTPSGKITITENGTDIDIAQYALADVNVEGGGGSSDFSTAEVTVVGTENEVYFWMPCIVEADDDLPATIMVDNMAGHNHTYIVPLYKGECDVPIFGATTVQCVGSATSDGGWVYITGDCTITIS